MIKKVVLLALLAVTVRAEGGLPTKSAPSSKAISSKSSSSSSSSKTTRTTTTTTSGGKTTRSSSFWSSSSSSKGEICPWKYHVRSVCFDDRSYKDDHSTSKEQCKKQCNKDDECGGFEFDDGCFFYHKLAKIKTCDSHHNKDNFDQRSTYKDRFVCARGEF